MQSDPGLHRLLLGVMGLPIGLLLVMLCGAELFTGNTMILTIAVPPPPFPHLLLQSLLQFLQKLVSQNCSRGSRKQQFRKGATNIAY